MNATQRTQLADVCRAVADLAAQAGSDDVWPGNRLEALAEAGVFRWFIAEPWGGYGWSETDLLEVYLELSQACLTTAFVLTQRQAAVGRIAELGNDEAKERLLPDLLAGRTFATVGISHLTTSRRHLAEPTLRARETDDGYALDGYSPWVTGADQAQTIVVGATCDDGRQLLIALPTETYGIHIPLPEDLVALNGSRTGRLECVEVQVARDAVLAGPMHEVMKAGLGSRTGGLQTSALAVGLTAAALDFLRDEASRRESLIGPLEALGEEHRTLRDDLLALARAESNCTNEEIRLRANSLVLRATQAALSAAKGTGFTASHPAGRRCREALFFLVWSCPQGVSQAHLCEWAGLSE